MAKKKAAQKTENKFHLQAKIHGNLDRGESPCISMQWDLFAKTIEELRKKVGKLQKDSVLGAGNWGECKVYDGKEFIGYMSFDGRIWIENLLAK